MSYRIPGVVVWGLNNRGVACRKLGKVEKARRDFEEALRIEPGFEQAKKNLEGLPHPPQIRRALLIVPQATVFSKPSRLGSEHTRGLR